jgi:hypothetical protein
VKTYKTFKLDCRIKAQADCYINRLWDDVDGNRDKALKLFKLYLKNWKVGLKYNEWKTAKALLSFWKSETFIH